jgi:hypothetical protein
VDPGVAKWWNAGKGLFEAYQLFVVDDAFEANVHIQLEHGSSIVMLTTPDELAGAGQSFSNGVRTISRRADVVVVGGHGFEKTVDFLRQHRLLGVGANFVPVKGDVTLLDGLMWGLHSEEKDLQRWISGGLGQQIRQAFLFHAPQKAILKAAWLPANTSPVSPVSTLST